VILFDQFPRFDLSGLIGRTVMLPFSFLFSFAARVSSDRAYSRRADDNYA